MIQLQYRITKKCDLDRIKEKKLKIAPLLTIHRDKKVKTVNVKNKIKEAHGQKCKCIY